MVNLETDRSRGEACNIKNDMVRWCLRALRPSVRNEYAAEANLTRGQCPVGGNARYAASSGGIWKSQSCRFRRRRAVKDFSG